MYHIVRARGNHDGDIGISPNHLKPDISNVKMWRQSYLGTINVRSWCIKVLQLSTPIMIRDSVWEIKWKKYMNLFKAILFKGGMRK